MRYFFAVVTWEHLYNPNFKVVEFDHFRMSAGLHSFVLSLGKWVEKTNAIGIIVNNKFQEIGKI